ncbi:MAG: hypothetical protein IJ394_07295 [Bacteroidales bacterium]|nr:hypothetical protein [Bacteroidales bacterium]
MKKIMSFVLASAALALAASCQKEVNPYDLSNADTPVTVTVQLPDGINTKAYGDGQTVKKVYYEIWTEGFANKVYPETGNTYAELSEGSATIEFTLVRGGVYSFVFWAMADGAPYTWDDMTAIKLNYTSDDTGIATGNEETRDAFCATVDINVTAGVSQTVTLKRPFAQLNFGADDMESTTAGTLTLTQSSVRVNKIASVYDATKGEGKEDIEINFTATGGALSEALTTGNESYTRLSTNYIIPVGANAQSLVSVSATFTATDETSTTYNVTHNFTELPIQQNYRTNVTGAIFTAKGSVTTTIDENFATPLNSKPITNAETN